MKRKVLVVVALMLVLSVSLAAMAYTDGYVHNTEKFKVASTENALLAVIPHDATVGYEDVTARVVGGKVVFNFGAGKDGAMFGLQPSSRYTWNDLIKIRNNSEDSIKVQITCGGDLANYLTITDKTTDTVVFNKGASTNFVLGSGIEHNYKFEIIVPQGADTGKRADDGGLVLNLSAVQ